MPLSTKTDPSFEEKRFRSVRLMHNAAPVRRMARRTTVIFLLCLLVLFVPWTQNIRSAGKLTTLTPQDRPQTVQTVIAGRIEKWFVREGQRVKKGDTIVWLSEVKEKFFDPAILQRTEQQIAAKQGSMNSVNEKVQALSRQILALREAQLLSLNKAQNKIRQTELKVRADSIEVQAALTDYDIAQLQLRRADSLYAKGLISLTDYERRKLKLQESNAKRISQESKLLISRTELINAGVELGSIEAEYLDKISKAESERNSALSYFFETEGEIAKMNNEYMNLRIRSGMYYVTAPQDGYVVQARVSGVGETLKEGDPVCTIMPADPQLAVELYVKPMDIPLLSVGQDVRLQFDGWPAMAFSGWPGVSFGTFGGKVAVIDYLDTKGSYRVLVTPDEKDKPWPSQLRVGSGAYGWAMLKDVPVGYELWRQVNGFPPDYNGPAAVAETKTTKDK